MTEFNEYIQNINNIHESLTKILNETKKINNCTMNFSMTDKQLYDANENLRLLMKTYNETILAVETCSTTIENIGKDLDKQIQMKGIDDKCKFIYIYKMKDAPYNRFSENIRDIITKSVQKLKNISEPVNKPEFEVNHMSLSSINSVKLNQMNLSIPVADNTKQIPPIFYWVKDENPGLRICITEGFYCTIPFPDVVSSTDENYKCKSTKCKYGTLQQCFERRNTLALLHNSQIRVCNFAHIGEKYNKLGTIYRCPNLERIGHHATLREDLAQISISDIKHLLMGALSDLVIAALWYQNNPKAGYGSENPKQLVLSNLDECI